MRAVIRLAATMLALWVGPVFAQAYPVRPITFVINFPPGTVIDGVARIVANEMSTRLGQPIVLDFKPGASGTIGAKFVVNARPDGYTLFYSTTSTISPVLVANNPVDAGKEMLPVSHFVRIPSWIITTAKIPVNTFADLKNYARTASDLKHGEQSANTALLMELFKARTGINSRPIPYKGSPPMLLALLSGEIDIVSVAIQPYLQHIKTGTAKALFVASDKRSPLLPDVPTAAEVGVVDFEQGNDYALWAPLGTPKEFIDKLNAAAVYALKLPAVAEQIRQTFAAEPVGSTPEELMRVYLGEQKSLAEAARLANFKPR